MAYTKGTILTARINKITEKGCYCTSRKQRIWFYAHYLMTCLLDDNRVITKQVGDTIDVVINKISDRGFLLSDTQILEKENKRLERNNNVRWFIENSKIGNIFETTILKVNNSNKIHIDLGGDIHGVIEKDEASWNEIEQLQALYFTGEAICAGYIGVENNELLFSPKHLNEKPYDDTLYDLDTDGILQYLGHNSNDKGIEIITCLRSKNNKVDKFEKTEGLPSVYHVIFHQTIWI